jgi:hypothetical protein
MKVYLIERHEVTAYSARNPQNAYYPYSDSLLRKCRFVMMSGCGGTISRLFGKKSVEFWPSPQPICALY